MGFGVTWRIVLKNAAKKFIDRLPKAQRKRLFDAISALPSSGDIKKMRGGENLYRLRVGDFRVIYTVEGEKLLVLVVAVGNRGDIYKSL